MASRRPELLPHFEAVEQARGEHGADLLRVHHARHHAAAVAGATRHGDPRGRPGRPARRRQRDRRRLRGDHQHRPRPHATTWAPTANRSAARRPASCGRAGRRWSATRCRRPASLPRCRGHRRRPVADRPRLQLLGRQAAVGLGRPRASASTRWPTRAARRQPAAECLGRASPCFEALRDRLPDHGAGHPQRPGHRRADRAASRSCRASRRWCSTWRTTRMRWPRWRRTSTRWASSRAPMRCSARWPTRTSRPSSRAWRRWSTHWYFCDLPIPRAATADGARRPMHARLALKGPGPVSVFRHPDPRSALRRGAVGSGPR